MYRFTRQEALVGEAAMRKLQNAEVAVFGLGGVGSWAAEALARGGIGGITLVDFDDISVTNINRQLFALDSTVGQKKAVVAANRLLDINPAIRVNPITERYTADAREAFLSLKYDYIIDAIDIVTSKLDLIQSALEREIPIVSCLGTGNRLDASGFRIDDISKTVNDPLARVMRKELRRRGILHVDVLWSADDSLSPADTGEAPPEGRRSIPGSVSWVPPVAGMMLAGYVIRSLMK